LTKEVEEQKAVTSSPRRLLTKAALLTLYGSINLEESCNKSCLLGLEDSVLNEKSPKKNPDLT
jgi:hypothetical protein